MKINTEIKTRQEADDLIKKLQNFSEKLEFGRWIVDEETGRISMYDNQNDLFYGVNSKCEWFCTELGSLYPSAKHKERYAADEEILSKLSKVAVKMGFVEGVRVVPMDSTRERVIDNYDVNHIEYDIDYPNSFNLGIRTIMKDGKWSEIIKEPKTDTERIELLEEQVKILQELIK